jgi:hypothetical protein
MGVECFVTIAIPCGIFHYAWVKSRLVAFVHMTSHTADSLFTVSNILLIFGAVIVLVGTIGVFWIGGIRERFADERISANEAKTSGAKAEAELARENTEKLKSVNLILETNLEKERSARLELESKLAYRHLSEDQKRAFVSALLPFAGQKVKIESPLGDAEAKSYRDEFVPLFEEAKWDHNGGAGIIEGAAYSIEPMGIEVTVHQVNESQGTTNDAINALIKVVGDLGLFDSGGPRMNPQVADGEVLFRVGHKTPISGKR